MWTFKLNLKELLVCIKNLGLRFWVRFVHKVFVILTKFVKSIKIFKHSPWTNFFCTFCARDSKNASAIIALLLFLREENKVKYWASSGCHGDKRRRRCYYWLLMWFIFHVGKSTIPYRWLDRADGLQLPWGTLDKNNMANAAGTQWISAAR